MTPISKSARVTAKGQQDSSENQSAFASLGGPGLDNFMFHPRLSGDTGHFELPAAATEFGQFAAVEDQHLLSLIKDVEFVPNSDEFLPSDLNAAQWHLVLQNAVHLH